MGAYPVDFYGGNGGDGGNAGYGTPNGTLGNGGNIGSASGSSNIAGSAPSPGAKGQVSSRIIEQYFGYYYLEGHLYKVVNESLTWEETKERAEELGGHLVTTTSEEENNVVCGLLNVYSSVSSANVWLRATDMENEGTWKWITGEAFNYTNWRDSEPNDSGAGEDCLSFYYKGNIAEQNWNDLPADYIAQGFIVEFD